MLCDAETHFLCHALPYLGKGSVDLSKTPYKTHGEYYIMELTAPFPLEGRVVTADNWFSTLQAAVSLQKKGLDFVGTVKDKPYLPKPHTQMKLKVGDSVALYNYEDKVTHITHQANKKKRVQLLTTIHHRPSVIEKVKTDTQMFYNATKGGVDTFDQLCANTSCIRSTRRWPMCFFFNLLNLSFTNSYILYQVKTGSGKKLPRHEFGLQVVDHLTRPFALNRLALKTLPRDLRYLIGSTFSVNPELPQDPDLDTEGTKKRSRCYLCPRASNKKSRVFCVHCKKYTCPDHYIIVCQTCIPT